MMKRTLIHGATIVNEGNMFLGDLLIEGTKIQEIAHGTIASDVDETVDATGLLLFPGIIDDHVHFREPGLTHKADIHSESRAAAAGGVTSYLDMPNVVPQTTTLEALEEKRQLGAAKSVVNYNFFFGATNNNVHLLPHLDTKRTCGVKLFMGASTGNMLVEKREILMNIFAKSPLLIMTHCEDSGIIAQNMALYKQRYGADPPIQYHPQIRSRAACIASSKLAMELAEKTGAQLHIAHISTYEELEMLRKYRHEEGSQNIAQITGEACLAHLLFTDKDYLDLGARIKCNPSVKTLKDRETLRTALNDGTIFIIGTDHAPHLPEEKVGGCIKAASGIPMIQFSLVSMLELAEKNVLNIPQVVTLMCHNPAKRFNIKQRGFIREGYNADIVLVRPHTKWTLKKEMIESKCGWSPLEGHTFSHQVVRTYCNGHCVYNNGVIDDSYRGEELVFEH